MLEQFIVQRQIRIFISSTFQDMHDERNYLIRKVFPRLQAVAERRDVSVVPLDLRWGITDEESRSGKVLEICLQEIAKSRPFFIGLIGNRYGWCPSREELNKNTLLKERWGDWLEQDIERGLSVTEIEMQYGVLRSKDPICAQFYIRRPSDDQADEGDEKLRRLKQAVRDNGHYPVCDYSSPEELGAMVEKAFLDYLNRFFPDTDLPDEARWHREQQAVLHQYAEDFIADEENMEVLESFAGSQEQNHLIIHGASGTGKSAMVANWCSRHEDEGVIYHFVGSMGNDDGFFQILRRLCHELCERFDLPFKSPANPDEREYREALAEVYRMASERGKCTIVIDGIDRLPLPEGETIFEHLPALPSKNLKYVFTSALNDRTAGLFKYLGYRSHQIKPLTFAERCDLIGKKLKRYGKKLPSEAVGRIAASPLCGNLSVLTMLLDEIIGYGQYETLGEIINFYLGSSSETDFYQKILERYEIDFPDSRPDSLFSLVALSYTGFTESELLELTGITQLHFSQFFCASHKHFRTRNGLLRIASRQMRDAIKKRYESNEKSTSKAIISFFEEKRTRRACNEMAGQYFLMKEDEALYDLLSDVWNARNIDDHALEVYWRALKHADGKRYSMKVYLREDPFIMNRLRDEYFRLGMIAADALSDYDTAADLLQPAWNAYKNDKKAEKLCQVIMACADMCRKSKAYQFAIGYFKMAMDLFKELHGEESLGVANVYNGLGLTYSDMGNWGKALKFFVMALDIQVGKHGELHPSVAALYGNIAKTAMEFAKPDDVLQFIEKAIGIEKILYGGVSGGLVSLYNIMGMVHHQRGDRANAISCYRAALEQGNLLWNGGNLVCAHCHSNIGTLCLETKDYATAEREYLMAIKILTETLGECHYETAKNLNNLGVVHHLTGELEKARQCYRSAIAIMERRRMASAITGEDYTLEIADIRKRLQAIESAI